MENNERDFIPRYILKVYQQKFQTNYYIEIHNVLKKEPADKGILGAGRPLQKKTLRRLLGSEDKVGQKSYFQSNLLHPRLLACEPAKFKRHILWYDPAGPKSMLFSKDVKTKTGTYVIPALLYFVCLDKIKIFSMKTGNRRPDQHTRLYYAPIYNQVGNHELCWGSVRKDTSDIEEIDVEMDVWNRHLWQSEFSEVGTRHVTVRSLKKIYKEIKYVPDYSNTENKRKGKPRFPGKDLIDAELTIKELLEKYMV